MPLTATMWNFVFPAWIVGMSIMRLVAYCASLNMIRRSGPAALLACIAFLGCKPAEETNSVSSPNSEPNEIATPIGAGFDFYVLALSWSPGYCASEGSNADENQCNSPRRYEFVVHGLWPQFEKGFPSDCIVSSPLNCPMQR